MRFEPGYTLPLSQAIKDVSDKPVFVAGRINTPQLADKALIEGVGRHVRHDEGNNFRSRNALKAETGRFDEIIACVGCNQACIGHMLNGQPISCIQRPETGRELTFSHLSPAPEKRKFS